MLFWDFKRLTFILEEAHEKNIDYKRLDSLVIEQSDLEVKLQEMRKSASTTGVRSRKMEEVS